MAWGIVESHEFRAELNAIIPDPVQSDAVLDAAVLYLSMYADHEPQLEETELYYKTVPYPKSGRMLVLWYTIEKERVVLQSATSFKIPDDPFE